MKNYWCLIFFRRALCHSYREATSILRKKICLFFTLLNQMYLPQLMTWSRYWRWWYTPPIAAYRRLRTWAVVLTGASGSHCSSRLPSSPLLVSCWRAGLHQRLLNIPLWRNTLLRRLGTRMATGFQCRHKLGENAILEISFWKKKSGKMKMESMLRGIKEF